MKTEKRYLIVVIVVGVLGATVITGLGYFKLRYRAFTVPTASMAPTIDPGSEVLVDRWSGHGHVKRWQIVVFRSKRGVPYIKRVVALGGERLRIENAGVVIDGHLVGLPPGTKGKMMPRSVDTYPCRKHAMKIPRGELFVIGDNFRRSDDSRDFGPIKQTAIIGVVTTWWGGHKPRKQWSTP